MTRRRLLTVLTAEGRLVSTATRIAQQIRSCAAASVAQIRAALATDRAALAVVQTLWRAVRHLGRRGAVCRRVKETAHQYGSLRFFVRL